MDISVNICHLVIKFYTGVHNIVTEGSVSQIFLLSFLFYSFYFMQKQKLRPKLKKMRHTSLQLAFMYMYFKFQDFLWNIN